MLPPGKVHLVERSCPVALHSYLSCIANWLETNVPLKITPEKMMGDQWQTTSSGRKMLVEGQLRINTHDVSAVVGHPTVKLVWPGLHVQLS